MIKDCGGCSTRVCCVLCGREAGYVPFSKKWDPNARSVFLFSSFEGGGDGKRLSRVKAAVAQLLICSICLRFIVV